MQVTLCYIGEQLSVRFTADGLSFALPITVDESSALEAMGVLWE